MKKIPLAGLFDAQGEEIAKRYGNEAATSANYGWGVGNGHVATKVYLDSGNMIIQTEAKADGTITHSWSRHYVMRSVLKGART